MEEPSVEPGDEMEVQQDHPAWMPKSVEQRRREFCLSVATIGVLAAAALGVLITGNTGTSETLAAKAVASAPTSIPSITSITSITSIPSIPVAGSDVEFELTGLDNEGVDVDGEPAGAGGRCTIGLLSVRLGASGDDVECLQNVLADIGHFTGIADGQFNDSTLRAVMDYQTSEGLFVDGVVGRESAVALNIWPDEESFVTRTPPPALGATDLWGVALSPVASAGDAAPPLPDNTGSGRRVVYDRAGQRVWAVRGDGVIIRSWLVSGSTYQNEVPGTHEVYSRSELSTAWNGKAWLPLMIRWLKTERGAIGFHAIPLHVDDNSPYQGDAELGTRLSGGCQRQNNLDAEFMWAFATLGTKVVVT
ncbi:peptidoglycan-binding protein [Ilumatobacter sp.]|uniref:L,D-transpeptidase family protein n=1 Tax=Ilumatobacter sp. TaxID=1967498 RepID=UPI003751F87D